MIQLSKIDLLNIGATSVLLWNELYGAATIVFIVLLVADVTFNYVSEVKNNLPLDDADCDCRYK